MAHHSSTSSSDAHSHAGLVRAASPWAGGFLVAAQLGLAVVGPWVSRHDPSDRIAARVAKVAASAPVAAFFGTSRVEAATVPNAIAEVWGVPPGRVVDLGGPMMGTWEAASILEHSPPGSFDGTVVVFEVAPFTFNARSRDLVTHGVPARRPGLRYWSGLDDRADVDLTLASAVPSLRLRRPLTRWLATGRAVVFDDFELRETAPDYSAEPDARAAMAADPQFGPRSAAQTTMHDYTFDDDAAARFVEVLAAFEAAGARPVVVTLPCRPEFWEEALAGADAQGEWARHRAFVEGLPWPVYGYDTPASYGGPDADLVDYGHLTVVGGARLSRRFAEDLVADGHAPRAEDETVMIRHEHSAVR